MSDVIIGIDAGTSMLKAIAFDLKGAELASAERRNAYRLGADGAATQPMPQTWADCAATVAALADRLPDLARRSVAVAVTGQGDGTWLIDRANDPVGEGWLWLDARAAAVADDLRGGAGEAARFAATGTGLTACQQGPQLIWMQRHTPEVLAAADQALHCKDWLYLCMTGQRATDPTEACFSFGNFRTRRYDDAVIDALGLGGLRRLLPPILDGSRTSHPLRPAAARAMGLRPGTPVVLGYLDAACTALGAGLREGGRDHSCSIIGSTGVHLRACPTEAVVLNPDHTGYVLVLPLPGRVAQMQTNMAGTLNIDWLLNLAAGVIADLAPEAAAPDLLAQLEVWIAAARPATMLYQPYISPAGERGPFVDPAARAGFIGLATPHRFADLARAVVEGLALAARDCHAAMGGISGELRLTGGAARSPTLRAIHAAALGAPVRQALRAEAGAAGAAMIAAVAIGAYGDMEACLADWVSPMLAPAEAPDPGLTAAYDRLFASFRTARGALRPVWHQLARPALAGPQPEPET